ncbi:uncharacterized protein BXIN_1473 [Babesia sp. Xinjiang]|uniref:uncharacterized protein n=1 Tax=Babesia sp. Xinjiang TaxID=462227 RepID=UPI000A241D29|nr:uncharacterized protein BXIN_1473 [Babesia sp. Xinjiang]ORM40015.1 hypothetical protein BXIN_1473 [Babesia sp. Xinjiang]
MDSSSRFNVLSVDFDPSSLLDESENVPFDNIYDRFYSSLLDNITDERVSAAVERMLTSKLSVGRLSHAQFLLPWRYQPPNEFSDSAAKARAKGDVATTSRGKNLKEGMFELLTLRTHRFVPDLRAFVSRSKGEAEITKKLLELRLTGNTLTRNACYTFLRSAYAEGREIVVCVKPLPGEAPVRYQGSIVFFDRGSNMLLGDVKVRCF